MSMSTIGLVLSGGGARAFAHLGLLQALAEWGIRPDLISGVSSGAIAGALYAAGHQPEGILAAMKGSDFFHLSNFSLHRDGFFSMRPLLDLLQEQVPLDSFEKLSIPLFVTVTDLVRNESLTFSKGPLFQAVIASCSVPVIFETVSWGERLLVDGGLLNNFPVEPIEAGCDRLIGSHVNKLPVRGLPAGRDGSGGHLGKAAMVERCFHLAIAHTVYEKSGRCAVFTEPLLTGFSMFDVHKADMIYEIGYKTALAHKDEWMAALWR